MEESIHSTAVATKISLYQMYNNNIVVNIKY